MCLGQLAKAVDSDKTAPRGAEEQFNQNLPFGLHLLEAFEPHQPTFCICENKDADQLRGNREADQRLCFRYIDSTIPLLSKSEI